MLVVKLIAVCVPHTVFPRAKRLRVGPNDRVSSDDFKGRCGRHPVRPDVSSGEASSSGPADRQIRIRNDIVEGFQLAPDAHLAELFTELITASTCIS